MDPWLSLEGEKYKPRASFRPMGGVDFVRVFNYMVRPLFFVLHFPVLDANSRRSSKIDSINTPRSLGKKQEARVITFTSSNPGSSFVLFFSS
jgi:hypothetical protein